MGVTKRRNYIRLCQCAWCISSGLTTEEVRLLVSDWLVTPDYLFVSVFSDILSLMFVIVRINLIITFFSIDFNPFFYHRAYIRTNFFISPTFVQDPAAFPNIFYGKRNIARKASDSLWKETMILNWNLFTPLIPNFLKHTTVFFVGFF